MPRRCGTSTGGRRRARTEGAERGPISCGPALNAHGCFRRRGGDMKTKFNSVMITAERLVGTALVLIGIALLIRGVGSIDDPWFRFGGGTRQPRHRHDAL